MLYYNVAEKRLELALPNFRKPFYVDFSKYAFLTRADLKRRELLRAAGFSKYPDPRLIKVFDLSAGFGQDAYLFYLAGFDLALIERSEAIAQLLEDGLKRAKCPLQVYKGEARDYLNKINPASLQDCPDIIYFDPMFSEKNKTALSKKYAQALQCMTRPGPHDDKGAETIFEQALTLAKNRVVIKRPAHGVFMAGKKPDTMISGKTIRFDVYLTVKK